MTGSASDDSRDWRRFVIAHGRGTLASDLATILRQTVGDIERIRAAWTCTKHPHRKPYAELFHLWQGREPADDEWPPPQKQGARGSYHWQGPELALLASLVGQLGKKEIAQILTERLRGLTKDQSAARSPNAVQLAINRIGMLAKDVVGGITTADAAHEIGSPPIIHQAIHKGDIRALRVGKRWVIPHDVWAEWKAKRVFPPAGYVPLSRFKGPLAIRSDKLSEFARLGYVPTAIRCNPFAAGMPSTQNGTWYIDGEVAARLVADRQAGRQMPWHGKPLRDNLRATYQLWLYRNHPATCQTCRDIWGSSGAPADFDQYAVRYPPLAHGAKRHLTIPWSPGLTLREVADKAGCSKSRVRLAIANGALVASRLKGRTYISRTNATRWISNGCSAGNHGQSWISLETACKRHLFTEPDLKTLIAQGKLKSKVGTDGAMRGIVYVSSHQCASLRETTGFTAQEAAQRAGVPLQHFLAVLDGVDWRNAEAIPLVTVQAVIKRLKSRPGYTIEEASQSLDKTPAWVEARIRDGTVKPLRRTWDPDTLYLSEPMMKRLRGYPADPIPEGTPPVDWLRLGDAAFEAGVSTATIIKWAEAGDLTRFRTPTGWRYPRAELRARARLYWRTVRFHRAKPPPWLAAEAKE